MNMYQTGRTLALALALAGIGGAALAASSQVSYLQVSGWANAAAEQTVNRQLAAAADAFTAQVHAIPDAGEMKGFGSLTMKTAAETDRLLSVAVDTYLIAPHQANGIARTEMKLFDKETGHEADAYTALGCDVEAVRQATLRELLHMQRQGLAIDRRAVYAKLGDPTYRPQLFLSANGPAVYFQRGEITPSVEGAIVVVLPQLARK